MTKEKILILGSSGLVGQQLLKTIGEKYNVFTTYHNSKIQKDDIYLDLASKKTIENAFEVVKPDIVINLCTIYKNLDFCEKNKDLVMAINGTSLENISKLSSKLNSYLISISSDFVFDGKRGNYRETDTVSPINFYGMSKVIGERNIERFSRHYCIVRTSMIYGRNSIRKTLPDMILDGIKNETEFKIIDDQFMTPTYLRNFCNMLSEIIEKKYQGIIHLTGPERMSRYDFAIKLLERIGLSKEKLIPVSKNEFEFGKIMPSDSSLNTEKAFSTLKEKPERIDSALDKYLDFKIN